MPSTQTITASDGTQLDAGVVNLARAIKQTESGNNYNATGASGEAGVAQWLPATWKAQAGQFLGDANAPMTPVNQDKALYFQINDWKQKGYSPEQVAAAWNAGEGSLVNNSWQKNIGVNAEGVPYDTPSYVNKVIGNFQQIKQQNGGTTATPNQPAGGGINGLPDYGATFPASAQDNPFVAGFKSLGNIPSSVYGTGAGLVSAALHPMDTVTNLGRGVIGGVENITGQNAGGAPDQNQKVANAIGKSLIDRYGSLEALQNTAENDPFGFGADVASLLYGGASIAGKGVELGDIGSRVAQTATSPFVKTAARAGELASTVGSKVLGGTDTEAINAATRAGIELPAGAQTTNPLVRAAETLALSGAGSSQAGARIERALSGMEDLATKITESSGGTADLSTAGEHIANGLQQFDNAFRKTNQEIFGAVEKGVGDIAAQTERSIGTIQQVLEQKAAIGESGDAKYFQDKLDILRGVDAQTGKFKPAVRFSTLKQLRTAVGEKIDKGFDDPFVRSNTAQLKRLYGALSEDLKATIRSTGNRELLQQYLRANKIYQQGRDVISSQYARSIQRFANQGDHSKIVEALFKPTMAHEDIPRILQVAGEGATKDIQTNVVQSILQKARNAEGDFTPMSIQREMKKWVAADGHDKLADILKPDQVQGLKDLGTLSRSLGNATKQLRGSQTAFLLKEWGALGAVGSAAIAAATGNLPLAAQILGYALGAEGASYFFASNTGQKVLRFGIEHGADVSAEAAKQGLTPTPPSDTLVPHDNIDNNRPNNLGATPNINARRAEAGNAGKSGLLDAGVPRATGGETAVSPSIGGGDTIPRGNSGGGGQSGEEAPLSTAQKKSPDSPLTSELKPATLGGRIKEALKNYLDNTQMGLSTKDVTEGGQKFNVGLTSVKGRLPSATDDLATEADTLYKQGDFAGAQKKYNEALAAGTNTLASAFEGTGIKLKPRGVGFGVYGDSLEPNYDAVAVVPKGKEDLFHYILADVADHNFHQFSMLTYRQTAADAPFGIVDEARGLSNEPFVRLALTKTLSAADVGELQAAAREAGLGGLSLREGGKSIDIINLSKYNDNYEQFTKGALDFQEKLAQRGILGEVQRGSAEARFVGSDPNEGHGLTSYQSFRDSFRAQNPGYFNTDENFTSRVLDRLKNKQAVSRTELEQMTKQQDITPTERGAVLDALSDFKGDMQKVPVSSLALKIKGKSLPIDMYETDQYATYGIREVGLSQHELDGGAKTLVFKTPVAHGNAGHFGDTSHFGHTRVVIATDAVSGKKIGYITEIQSDVFQKESDLAAGMVGYDKIAEAKKAALDTFGYDDKVAAIKAERAAGDQSSLQEDSVARQKLDQLNTERQKILNDAEQKTIAENTTPQMKQLLFQGKNNRYQDTLLRGTMQYFEKKGVDTVRIATPSSVAKIEGYINEDNLAPYEIDGERANANMGDLSHGDTIQYGGEDYTVVDAGDSRIEVAPSDQVHSFTWSEYVDGEAQNAWDDQAKSDFEPLATNGGDITPEAAQKALDAGNGFDWHGSERILKDIAEGDQRVSLSDIEEKVKEKAAISIDFSDLEDTYGRGKVFTDGSSRDETVYVVDGNTETMGQPSEYEGGLDESQAQAIDPHPSNSTTPHQADTTIDENFNNTYATVLKGYVEMYDRFLRKLAKEENVPINYVDGNYDSTWYELPLTKVKRYLFG